MTILLAALLIGAVTGLRTMTGVAAVSWAAHLGILDVSSTWAGFMGAAVTPYLLSAAAAAEWIGDKLPQTPSRKSPLGFAGRFAVGAFGGAVIGAPTGEWLLGLAAGPAGAVVGTLGGYEARTRLVAATGGSDLPVALAEDALAVLGAVFVVTMLLNPAAL
jgi:uncharacterized membrane protein